MTRPGQACTRHQGRADKCPLSSLTFPRLQMLSTQTGRRCCCWARLSAAPLSATACRGRAERGPASVRRFCAQQMFGVKRKINLDFVLLRNAGVWPSRSMINGSLGNFICTLLMLDGVKSEFVANCRVRQMEARTTSGAAI